MTSSTNNSHQQTPTPYCTSCRIGSAYIAFAPLQVEGRELLSVKSQLLADRYGDGVRLDYRTDGAPLLQGTTDQVSLSHTSELLAMAFSPHRVGIDIEQKARCNVRLVHRILNAEEKLALEVATQQFPNAETDILSACWTSKEAVYKLLSAEGVSTITQIELQFSPTDGLPRSATFAHHLLRLHHFQQKDHWGTLAEYADRD